ncbi:MAG: SLATT domain-containing protein [Proteobacteria bacterium]|nr:SLATT domain-containing protein [Pseudomonadota bacterium]NBP15317.1 SLATT domain-containing protein [bacterium]
MTSRLNYASNYTSDYTLDSRLNSRNFDSVLDRIVGDTDNIRDTNQNDAIEVNANTAGGGGDGGDGEPGGNGGGGASLEHKMDVLALTNGWNDKNESIIISVGENAASYKWMHERSASWYKTINRILSIVMIVFSTGLSAETIIPTSNENLAVDIVRRVFTYIITLISVLQNFLKYEKLSEQHMAAAMAHAQLYHEIQQQMCMFRRDRNNATNYVASVLKQYDSLIVNGPEISARIIQQFKNTFKNSDISLPDIADRIQKIEIVTEPIQMQSISVVAGNNGNGGGGGIGGSGKNNSKGANIEVNTSDKRYGRYGVCNLQQIHNAFQIQGDITDNDIQNANQTELRDLRNKFLREKSTFEYNRYLQHNQEND